MFGSYFYKLLFRIVFENIKNMTFSENYSYYPNLVFYGFFIFFFITIKLRPNVFLFFRKKKHILGFFF